ncbi:hypothetical protein [Oricola indica]|jgi:hypothetical protein|uniref:hypothetical protein n=1 Tax=Oricola indica TaxID=2872591 RepID=UPI003CCBB387
MGETPRIRILIAVEEVFADRHEQRPDDGDRLIEPANHSRTVTRAELLIAVLTGWNIGAMIAWIL